MSKFTNAFMKRTDIVPNLKEGLKCDALVVVGTKSSHVHAAEYMHSHMDKVKFNLNKGFKIELNLSTAVTLGLNNFDIFRQNHRS